MVRRAVVEFAPLTANTSSEPGTGLPSLSRRVPVTVVVPPCGALAEPGVSVSEPGMIGAPPTARKPQMKVFGVPFGENGKVPVPSLTPGWP